MASKKRTYSSDPLGPTIERLMAETGVTYRALAEKTGLSAGYLNHIVHGNRPVPSNDVLARIAKALGVQPDHFREVRVRIITEKLEETPALVERLYKRLA
jgi:transcriptional regulator with XRE-family HTH domain